MAKSYLVKKDFDFAARGNVVMTFKEGETRSNLTRACVAKGQSLGALKPITEEDES